MHLQPLQEGIKKQILEYTNKRNYLIQNTALDIYRSAVKVFANDQHLHYFDKIISTDLMRHEIQEIIDRLRFYELIVETISIVHQKCSSLGFIEDGGYKLRIFRSPFLYDNYKENEANKEKQKKEKTSKAIVVAKYGTVLASIVGFNLALASIYHSELVIYLNAIRTYFGFE